MISNLFFDKIIVNKKYALHKDYVPYDLKLINFNFSTKDIYLRSEAKFYFEKLCSDAFNLGFNIKADSGYRDYYYQENLFEFYVSKYGYEYASKISAKPGHSEHQTGLAVDVRGSNGDYNSFGESIEFDWMIDNAHNYGFILRYPKGFEEITGYNYEPWHFRYVGRCAEEIKIKNLVLETYLKK